MSINFLHSKFYFNQNDFPPQNDCEILSGPKVIKMNRGQMGKWWMVRRNVYCFKISIEDDHNNNIDQALETVSRLPLLYLIGLEIVSDDNENGMALYKNLGGAAGHGGRTYCNLIGLNLGVLIHELGHAIEQEVRLTSESDLLDRWKNDAKSVDEWHVSPYGDQNPWEDMAEYCKVYSVALQNDRLEELKTLSPNRYEMWTHCINLVSTTLRNPRCADSGEVPIAPEPVSVDDGPNDDDKEKEDPPEDYEPDTEENTASTEYDYYYYLLIPIVVLIFLVALYIKYKLKNDTNLPKK